MYTADLSKFKSRNSPLCVYSVLCGFIVESMNQFQEKKD